MDVAFVCVHLVACSAHLSSDYCTKSSENPVSPIIWCRTADGTIYLQTCINIMQMSLTAIRRHFMKLIELG